MPDLQDLPLTPVPKPRQTRRDRWAQRACVMRYRAFCDELRLRRARLPDRYALIFVMPMPASWSATKRAQMCGRPHVQKPDLTNLEKSVEDALVKNDERLFSNRGIKVWGEHGRVLILSRAEHAHEESDSTLLALALGKTIPETGDKP
jgi:Holliday junction resolvase RusA-like endonuclease